MCIVVVLSGTIGYILYRYQEQIRFFIGKWLLYFHLGKNNEIYTSQIPENHLIRSISSAIDIKEELMPF
jgi:hypothetical protein